MAAEKGFKKNPIDDLRCERTTTRMNTFWAGPIPVRGEYINEDITVPLATLEIPLIYGTIKGARVASMPGVDGVHVQIHRDWMTRAPVLETNDACQARELSDYVTNNYQHLKEVGDSTSRFGRVTAIHGITVDNLYFMRFQMDCKDAAGHTMSEKAAARIVQHLIKHDPQTRLLSLSGNFCEDKKPGMVNTILGRGKSATAWVDIPREAFEAAAKGDPACKYVKGIDDPYTLVKLNTVKNHLGSMLAGNAMGGNAHHANVYAAIAAATGQDLANVVEGSQGVDHVTYDGKKLHFAVYMPSIIVGTKGGPANFEENIPDQTANLKRLGCYGSGNPVGSNAKRLAEIVAATTWCAEFNLMSVLSQNYELIRSHEKLERGTL